MTRSALLAVLVLLFCCPIKAEIVGKNYYGRNLEVLFSRVTGWKNGTDFRAKTKAILPSFIEFNDVIEFDCFKGADTELIARASAHAYVSVRFCDKSLVLEKLDQIKDRTGKNTYGDPLLKQLNSLQKIYHSEDVAHGMVFSNYQVPLIGVGHGVGISWLTITTSVDKPIAIITRVNFHKDESRCLSEVFCKYDGMMMSDFNQHILKDIDKYLAPSINEIKSHFAYSVSVADWKKIGSLDELLKQSGAIDLVHSKYPGLILEGNLAGPLLGGDLRRQENGVYRAYIIMIFHFDETRYSTDTIDKAKKTINKTFDSYMTTHLRNLSILNE